MFYDKVNMNLTPVDWNDAQNLLIKLVQALSPLTVRAIPASFFFNRRFIIPQSYSHEEFQHRVFVRILSTLHEVQKEVEEWIAEPHEEMKTLKEVREVSKSRSKAKENLEEKPVRREGAEPKEKNDEARKEIPSTSKGKHFYEESRPLTKQAKELIHQVQEAIGQLSHSDNIKEPKETPLIQTLKELKPKLDRVIEYVRKSSFAETDHPSPFRHALPASARQELLQKLHSLKGSPQREPRTFEKQTSQETAKEKLTATTPRLILKAKGEGETEKRGEGFSISSTHKGKQHPIIPAVFHAEKVEKEQDVSKIDPKVIALPGASILFEPKRIQQNRKKKKRKGFWFKEEDPGK